MPVYKAEGIVLRRSTLKEADRLITLFTREWGKIVAVARGARKPTSRLGGRLEPLARVRALLAVGRTFDIITQVEVVAGAPRLAADLDRWTHAIYAAELVDRSTGEREPLPEIFDLFARALELLGAGQGPEPSRAGAAAPGPADPASAPGVAQAPHEVRDHPEEYPRRNAAWAQLVVLRFTMRLLTLIGYEPHLDTCVACGRAISGASGFSFSLGGALCGRCRGQDAQVLPANGRTLVAMEALRRAEDDTLEHLGLTPSQRAEAGHLLQRYTEERLEVRLRSPLVIASLATPVL